MIQRWLGHDRPKQYCAFAGRRSMLQHTLDRVAEYLPRDQTITVLGTGHRMYLDSSDVARVPGLVLEQPANCGTAVGIMLPATHVMAEDPSATLMIFPSDHFIRPQELFISHLRFAHIIAHQYPDHLILLGATPDGPEPEYGWIVTGERKRAPVSYRLVPDALEVLEFWEKPDPAEAQRLFYEGSLWNTMIVVVKVKTLWNLAWVLAPDMMSRFESLLHILRSIRKLHFPSENEELAVKQAYEGMAAVDFSRDILQQADGMTLVIPMDGVAWSDWGRPERVVQTLQAIGITPAFPLEAMA
jgi:mannose-1-phosphate guanylyltransferase